MVAQVSSGVAAHQRSAASANVASTTSKAELITWANATLALELSSIQQFGNGAVFCQLLDAYFPNAISMHKVSFHAKEEYEIVPNWKQFQAGLDSVQWQRDLDVPRLSNGSPAENLELLQWMYRLLTLRPVAPGYKATARRGQSVKGGTNDVRPPTACNSPSFDLYGNRVNSPSSSGRSSYHPSGSGKIDVSHVTSKFRDGLAPPCLTPGNSRRRLVLPVVSFTSDMASPTSSGRLQYQNNDFMAQGVQAGEGIFAASESTQTDAQQSDKQFATHSEQHWMQGEDMESDEHLSQHLSHEAGMLSHRLSSSGRQHTMQPEGRTGRTQELSDPTAPATAEEAVASPSRPRVAAGKDGSSKADRATGAALLGRASGEAHVGWRINSGMDMAGRAAIDHMRMQEIVNGDSLAHAASYNERARTPSGSSSGSSVAGVDMGVHASPGFGRTHTSAMPPVENAAMPDGLHALSHKYRSSGASTGESGPRESGNGSCASGAAVWALHGTRAEPYSDSIVSDTRRGGSEGGLSELPLSASHASGSEHSSPAAGASGNSTAGAPEVEVWRAASRPDSVDDTADSKQTDADDLTNPSDDLTDPDEDMHLYGESRHISGAGSKAADGTRDGGRWRIRGVDLEGQGVTVEQGTLPPSLSMQAWQQATAGQGTADDLQSVSGGSSPKSGQALQAMDEEEDKQLASQVKEPAEEEHLGNELASHDQGQPGKQTIGNGQGAEGLEQQQQQGRQAAERAASYDLQFEEPPAGAEKQLEEQSACRDLQLEELTASLTEELPASMVEQLKEQQATLEEHSMEQPASLEEQLEEQPGTLEERSEDQPKTLEEQLEKQPETLEDHLMEQPASLGNHLKEQLASPSGQLRERPASLEEQPAILEEQLEEQAASPGEQLEEQPASPGEQLEEQPASPGEQLEEQPGSPGEQLEEQPASPGEQLEEQPASPGEQLEQQPTSLGEQLLEQPAPLHEQLEPQPAYEHEEKASEDEQLTDEPQSKCVLSGQAFLARVSEVLGALTPDGTMPADSSHASPTAHASPQAPARIGMDGRGLPGAAAACQGTTCLTPDSSGAEAAQALADDQVVNSVQTHAPAQMSDEDGASLSSEIATNNSGPCKASSEGAALGVLPMAAAEPAMHPACGMGQAVQQAGSDMPIAVVMTGDHVHSVSPSTAASTGSKSVNGGQREMAEDSVHELSVLLPGMQAVPGTHHVPVDGGLQSPPTNPPMVPVSIASPGPGQRSSSDTVCQQAGSSPGQPASSTDRAKSSPPSSPARNAADVQQADAASSIDTIVDTAKMSGQVPIEPEEAGTSTSGKNPGTQVAMADALPHAEGQPTSATSPILAHAQTEACSTPYASSMVDAAVAADMGLPHEVATPRHLGFAVPAPMPSGLLPPDAAALLATHGAGSGSSELSSWEAMAGALHVAQQSLAVVARSTANLSSALAPPAPGSARTPSNPGSNTLEHAIRSSGSTTGQEAVSEGGVMAAPVVRRRRQRASCGGSSGGGGLELHGQGKLRSVQDGVSTLLRHTTQLLGDINMHCRQSAARSVSAPGAEGPHAEGHTALARVYAERAAALQTEALAHAHDTQALAARLEVLAPRAMTHSPNQPSTPTSPAAFTPPATHPRAVTTEGSVTGSTDGSDQGKGRDGVDATEEVESAVAAQLWAASSQEAGDVDAALKAVGVAQFSLVQGIYRESLDHQWQDWASQAPSSPQAPSPGAHQGSSTPVRPQGEAASNGGVTVLHTPGQARASPTPGRGRAFKLGEYQLKQLRNGDVYKGRRVGSRKEGDGVYLFKNGDVYEGEFRQDRMDGHGVYTFSHEGRYEGSWRGAVYNGAGSETFARGSIYSGEYESGLRCGWGVCRFYNGDYYEGQWLGGLRHGQGVQQCTDDSNYVGEYCRGKRHGHGVYTFPNGDKYAGQYCDDLPHGSGVYVFAAGQRYEGEWQAGRKHGWSTYSVEDGSQYSAHWHDGKPTWAQPAAVLTNAVAAAEAAPEAMAAVGDVPVVNFPPAVQMRMSRAARRTAMRAAALAERRAMGHWDVHGNVQPALRAALAMAQEAVTRAQAGRARALELAHRLDVAVALATQAQAAASETRPPSEPARNPSRGLAG